MGAANFWGATFFRLIIITAGIISLLDWLPFFFIPAHAQETTTFEIAITPQTDYALTDSLFTYTVTVTNTGSTAPTNIVIKIPLPSGATYQSTDYTNENWYAGGIARGQSGDFVWFSQQPVPAGQVNTFQLVVKVTAPPGLSLRLTDYLVTNLDEIAPILGSGPPVIVPIFSTAPTPSPTQPESAPAVAFTVLPSPVLSTVTQPAETGPVQVKSGAIASTIPNQANILTIALFITGAAIIFALVVGLVWLAKQRYQ